MLTALRNAFSFCLMGWWRCRNPMVTLLSGHSNSVAFTATSCIPLFSHSIHFLKFHYWKIGIQLMDGQCFLSSQSFPLGRWWVFIAPPVLLQVVHNQFYNGKAETFFHLLWQHLLSFLSFILLMFNCKQSLKCFHLWKNKFSCGGRVSEGSNNPTPNLSSRGEWELLSGKTSFVTIKDLMWKNLAAHLIQIVNKI